MLVWVRRATARLSSEYSSTCQVNCWPATRRSRRVNFSSGDSW
ncbi:hypothetical protein [Streptomyces sp. C10-9-1]